MTSYSEGAGDRKHHLFSRLSLDLGRDQATEVCEKEVNI